MPFFSNSRGDRHVPLAACPHPADTRIIHEHHSDLRCGCSSAGRTASLRGVVSVTGLKALDFSCAGNFLSMTTPPLRRGFAFFGAAQQRAPFRASGAL